MTSIDDLLAPGRGLELLSRRAARGHRVALRLLLQHAPTVLEAEERWLLPTLLRSRPGGAGGAWRVAHDGEHEQMLELIACVARHPQRRADPMFRALHGLLLRHVRDEREWLADAVAAHGTSDEPAFARYVAHCRPVLDAVAALGANGDGERAPSRPAVEIAHARLPAEAANDEPATADAPTADAPRVPADPAPRSGAVSIAGATALTASTAISAARSATAATRATAGTLRAPVTTAADAIGSTATTAAIAAMAAIAGAPPTAASPSAGPGGTGVHGVPLSTDLPPLRRAVGGE